MITDLLEKMNTNYLFTVNSQPKANSVPSTDPIFGWGPAGGYVYQKQYVEILIPNKFMEALVACLNEFPLISYQGTNFKGEEISNVA
jgi:methylenetetrahydrofolate reductase (NADPH)